MATDEVARIRGYLTEERRAALLYRRLADQVEGEERAILTRLADDEEAHAEHWERVLDRLGATAPTGGIRLRASARIAVSLGRRVGLVGAMPALERHEGREITTYLDEPHATDEMVADERDHTAMVRSLAPTWRTEVAGTLRAGIFGISDGIVSNLALVIGVFGAGASRQAVTTAGIAGLVAGALSMGVGEYVSVASQREVLQAGDHDHGDANPVRAAVASLLTFAFGALVPLLPFLVGGGTAAAVVALVATGSLLYGVGAALSLLTMRSGVRSGLRQLLLGWGAAGATYLVGLLIGGGTPV